MSDINIQMQDSTGNNVYPQTKAEVVKIGSTDAKTMLTELEGREEVFVEVTEPTKDGLWIDTSDSEYGGSESQLATQVKTYVDGKLDPVINEVQTARNGETVLDDRLDKIDNVEVYGSETTTSNEINDINVDVQKQIKVNVSGKTFNNILGNDGNCEDVSRFNDWNFTHVLDSSNKVFGGNSIKATITSTTGNVSKPMDTIVDKTKYYCFSGYLKNGTFTNGIQIAWQNTGGTSVYGNVITDTTKFTRVWVKIKPSDMTSATTIFAIPLNPLTNPTSGQYGYFDGLMLEEITQAQYNDSTFKPSPFIDSDVSVGEIPCKIKTVAKNIGENYYKVGYYFDANVGVTTNPITRSIIRVPVKENTSYTFSCSNANRWVVGYEDRNLAIIGSENVGVAYLTNNIVKTFTTPSNCAFVSIYFGNMSDTTYVMSEPTNIQLEEGSTGTTYEPYKESYINVDKALRSLPNGVKDEIINNKLIQRVGKVILDGSMNWKFMDSFTGYKRVWCGFTTSDVVKSTVTNGYGMFYGLKYNGKSLGSRINAEAIGQDQAYIDYGYNGVFVTIPSSDSGWGDSYTPTTDEIKAYFNGYKMIVRDTTTIYNGTGNKGWRNIGQPDSNVACYYDVTTTTYNNGYGYIPYRAYYQLVTPIVTELSFPNLIAYPNGDLVIESAYQSFIRPIVKYTLIDSTRANIAKLEEGLSDSKRQFMSYIGANDKSVAQIANSNILLNGDFRNPINQRGASVYNTNAYSIDRWVLTNGISLSLFNEVSAKGIRLVTTSASSSCGIMQLLEFPTTYSGKTVTLTVKYRTTSQFAKVYLHSRERGNFGNIQFKYHDNEWHTESITVTVPKLSLDTSWLEIGIQFWNQSQTYAVGEIMDIEFIKLEYGALSTPFMPRSYSEELILCKRYYEAFTQWITMSDRVYTGNLHYCSAIPLVEKRVTPTVTYGTANWCLVAILDYSKISTNADTNKFMVQPIVDTTGYSFTGTNIVCISGKADSELY